MLASPAPATASQPLVPRNFQYKLPDGYTIERTTNPNVTTSEAFTDPNAFDPAQVYVSTLTAMLGLAYEDSSGLTGPTSYPYQGIVLNITGADESSQYYRQFASYILYHALDAMSSTDTFVISNFTLQDSAGVVACKVVYGPPNALFQQLIDSGITSGGTSPPRRTRRRARSLPELLNVRQTIASQNTNTTAKLDTLRPFWAPAWYGPSYPSPAGERDFYMALSTLVVKLSDTSQNAKDVTTYQESAETEGYHLNITALHTDESTAFGNSLTPRGCLNMLGRAVTEGADLLGHYVDFSNFEIALLWVNATGREEPIQHYVLRYEGVVL